MKVIDLGSKENTRRVTINNDQYRIDTISENMAYNLMHDERFTAEQSIECLYQSLVILSKELDTPIKKQAAKRAIRRVDEKIAYHWK